ncbi:MAG: HYExAFE family protein [Planctomycetota bacterium]|nr:HYExAFE family protein [Planctomycetota bacterium]
MADRHNHYEAAFEAYIRAARVPCVAVNEAKRSLCDDEARLKNPDFLLYPRCAPNLVVEVKGKRAFDDRGRRPWENWVTTDDLDGLARWQTLFGPGFRALLVFAYAEPLRMFPLPSEDDVVETRGLVYRFWGVERDDYIEHLRSRGPAWKAVQMARSEFRRRVRPLREWLPMARTATPRPRSLRELRR